MKKIDGTKRIDRIKTYSKNTTIIYYIHIMLFTPLLIYTSIINIYNAKKSVYYREIVPFITKPLLAEI